MFTLNSSIENLPRVGQKQAEKLAKLKIVTIGDLLFHFPVRYDDLSNLSKIADLKDGQSATVIGKITNFALKQSWRKKMKIIEMVVGDGSGSLKAVWFNQEYLLDSLTYLKEIRLSGKAVLKNGIWQMNNPIWESARAIPNHTGRLLPIYPETKGITSRWFRWQIKNIFETGFEIEDPLPAKIRQKYKLPEIKQALYNLHFPRGKNSYLVAQKRMAFFDMFLLQLRARQIRSSLSQQKGYKLSPQKTVVKQFISSLPFKLTASQEKAWQEITGDLSQNNPMNRLLNGDVGAGKTVVAMLASLQTSANKRQTALMAPTEILARQHFQEFCRFLSQVKKQRIKIFLLTNSFQEVYITDKKERPKKISRAKLLKEIEENPSAIIIGTHALIQEKVKFPFLGLIIIDEQHRFGVKQRAYLQEKHCQKNTCPHFLTMTATPIPRTISLTLLGSLDVSLLTDKPANRQEIETTVVAPPQSAGVYEFIRKKLQSGEQCFVILPLVEESEKLAGLKAVVTEHRRLQEKIFPEFKIGLLHGRLKPEEKEAVMRSFQKNEIQVLASTSVVEVGVDVPNATMMIIEDSYRFGLAQLHQFRGRIGRGNKKSYCFLFSDKETPRLKILSKYSDGFKIAEKDLKLRGPGDFLGQKQSGLGDATLKNITNLAMIKIATAEAEKIISSDPKLEKYPLLQKELKKFYQRIHLE